jgi:acyl dehydratase
MLLADLEPGARFGPSNWIDVTQARVDSFADATSDYQWIHVDVERAAKGPYGTTIAHGWLSLALLAPVVFELLPLEGVTLVNYGADRVRFPAALPVGSRVRGTISVSGVTPASSGTRLTLETVLEREHGTKPVCVALVLVHAAT